MVPICSLELSRNFFRDRTKERVDWYTPETFAQHPFHFHTVQHFQRKLCAFASCKVKKKKSRREGSISCCPSTRWDSTPLSRHRETTSVPLTIIVATRIRKDNLPHSWRELARHAGEKCYRGGHRRASTRRSLTSDIVRGCIGKGVREKCAGEQWTVKKTAPEANRGREGDASEGLAGWLAG